jgi:hypothetical protein
MMAQKQIREWCDKDGRKLGWIAKQVPINANNFSAWMTGRRVPSAVYRHRIADITGIEDLRFENEWISAGDMA